jgi:glycosyltransferase involved in cell wall biosynthesis
MRIALASIHPRPLSGQIEGLVGLAQAMESRGHRVAVVSAFPTEMLLSAERLKLTSAHRWSFVDYPIRVARIVARLVALAPHVDLIQLNLPTPAFALLGDIVQMLVRVPVIVAYEAHLVNPRDLLRYDRLREAPLFYVPRLFINNRLVARFALNRAARYLVSSKLQRNELVDLGIAPKRISRLPNLMPRDKLAPAPPEQIRAKWNLPPGRLITYIGHYNHVKGVEVLVDAFQQLAARRDDVHLVLAWSGVGKSRRADDLLHHPHFGRRVVQLGRVNVADLLSVTEVVVLPYRLTIGQAVFPATLLEALAANVPVVTSDLPLLRELTEEGQTALLAPPDNPAAFAEMIERVLSEPDLVRRMTAAQQRWWREMCPTCVVKDYERFYRQTLEEQARVLQPARDRANV